MVYVIKSYVDSDGICQQYSSFTGKSNKKSSINACEEPFSLSFKWKVAKLPRAFSRPYCGIFVRGATPAALRNPKPPRIFGLLQQAKGVEGLFWFSNKM